MSRGFIDLKFYSWHFSQKVPANTDLPLSSLNEANPTNLASRAFDRFSNAKCEVCGKHLNLSYFLVRDFSVYNDNTLKTYAYTKYKCLVHADHIYTSEKELIVVDT